MVKKSLTLNEAALKLDISTDTLRRWDKKGMIKSARNENNFRIFDVDEIKRLNLKTSTISNNFKILKDKHRSKYKVIDLFAGAGGTASGFHNAGFNHEFLVEIDNDCVNTLRKNMPKWNVVKDDVTNISFKNLAIDVIEGGFPCQSFSYAGKRMGFSETRGTLFFQFARAINEARPKIAVAENVRGLVSHDNGRTLDTMINALKEIGYRTDYKVLKSQYLDVPQKRERLIIIAIRDDLDIPFIFPKEKNYIIPIKSALINVPKSIGQTYSEYKKKIMDLVPPGGYWRDLPVNIQKSYMGASYFHTGGKTGMARRISWDEPCLTLTTSPSQKQTERCHPSETRPFTVREYARIQTFPDEWEFSGGVTSQYKQIGNAVPVNLGYHIAKSIKAMLDNDYNADDFEIISSDQNKSLSLI